MEKADVIKALNNYVMFDGIKYKAYRYEAWKDDNGKLHHSLRLIDKSGHCDVVAPIERIELVEDNGI